MRIGSLPKVDKIEDDTLVVISQTGNTAQTTEAKNLALGGGKGLKYWVEDETSITRVVDVEGTIDFSTKYMVPGKAKMMIETVRKETESIDEIKSRYAAIEGFVEFTTDPETGYWIAIYNNQGQVSQVTIDHDPDDHIGYHEPLEYYYLERQSDTPVMGGACCYKYWENYADGSRLPSAKVGSVIDGGHAPTTVVDSSHDFYVRGWCLVSTNKLDLIYDFVHEDAMSGDKTVLQTVTSSNTEYRFGDVTLYVNGFVDPELYESHALWNTFGGNFSGYPNIYPYITVPEGYPDAGHNAIPNHLPYYLNQPYRTDAYTSSAKHQCIAGSWFYKDDRYEANDVVRSAPAFFPTRPKREYFYSPDGIHYIDADIPRSYWVTQYYQDGNFGSMTPLGDLQVYSVKWLGDRTYQDGSGNTYTDMDYEFFGPPLPWLGCCTLVYDVDEGYDGRGGMGGEHKDMLHYFYHDAEIKEAFYYFTGIDSGTGSNAYAFYTGVNTGEHTPGTGVSGDTKTAWIDRMGNAKFRQITLENGEKLEGITGIATYEPTGNNNLTIASIDIGEERKLIKAPKTGYTPIITTGTRIGTLNCGGDSIDIYAPSGGGGGGSSVSFTQTRTSGDELGTLTIDGVGTKIYGYSADKVSVTPSFNSGTKIATIDIDHASGSQSSHDIYIPGGSGFGYATGSIDQDSGGNALTTQGGPYTITINNLKTTGNGSTAFAFTSGVWKFDALIHWKMNAGAGYSYGGQDNIKIDISSKSNAGVWNMNALSGPLSRYTMTPAYAGESIINIDIPLTGILIVSSNQSTTPLFTLRVTHDKWQNSYTVSNIDWSLNVTKIGEY